MISQRKFLRLASLFIPFAPSVIRGQALSLNDPALLAASINSNGGGGGASDTVWLTTFADTDGSFITTLTTDEGTCFVANANKTVTALGRYVFAGASGSHLMKILNGSGGTLGSATLNLSGATSGQFAYVTLSPAVSISSGSSYSIQSHEANGGDEWYNFVTMTTITTGTVFGSSTSDSCASGDGYGNGPVNFKYH